MAPGARLIMAVNCDGNRSSIVEVNEELSASPEMLNSDPYGDGWIFRLAPDNRSDLDALMDAAGYRAQLGPV